MCYVLSNTSTEGLRNILQIQEQKSSKFIKGQQEWKENMSSPISLVTPTVENFALAA